MLRPVFLAACFALLPASPAARADDAAALKAAEEPAEKPGDKPADKSAEKPAEKPARPAEPPQRTPRFMPGAMGELKKLEEGSITLQSLPPRRIGRDGKPVEKDNKPPADPVTLTIDGNTMVFVGVQENERDINGRKVRTARFNRGSLADLKVGQKVMFAADGDRAARLSIMPPEPPPTGDGL